MALGDLWFAVSIDTQWAADRWAVRTLALDWQLLSDLTVLRESLQISYKCF